MKYTVKYVFQKKRKERKKERKCEIKSNKIQWNLDECDHQEVRSSSVSKALKTKLSKFSKTSSGIAIV